MKTSIFVIIISVVVFSCKKESLKSEDPSLSNLEYIQNLDSKSVISKIKSHPENYIYFSFKNDTRFGICQMNVVGMAVGPFTTIPNDPNHLICQSIYGAYQFYVAGRQLTIPVLLYAKKQYRNRQIYLFSSITTATSLPSADDYGLVGVEKPFKIPLYETIDFGVTPIPCGQSYSFSYTFTGPLKNGNASSEEFMSMFSSNN